MKNLKEERELLSKPGDTILETIDHLRISQADLAERMGKTPSKINDLISGKEAVTVKTAMQLERVLGIDAQFWLNRESLYREKLTRIEQEEIFEQCLDWMKEQPVKELNKYGYLKSDKKGAALVDELLQFYAVVSPYEWENIYVQDYANADFKKSNKYRSSLSAMAAVLRIGEIEMQKIELPEFDKSEFKLHLESIRKIARDHPEDYALQLKNICQQCGVGLVFSMCFPGAPISGVTRWIGGNPLIQLTDRYKTNDHFWSAFFHEVGHIVLHGKKDVFIEDFTGIVIDEKKENEANKFSDEILIPSHFLKNVDSNITEKEIKTLAREAGVHPGILVGRLQRLEIIEYKVANNLKIKVYLDSEIIEQAKR